jgi:hypothetical protein
MKSFSVVGCREAFSCFLLSFTHDLEYSSDFLVELVSAASKCQVDDNPNTYENVDGTQ